jgi:hypothetical protein
MIFTHKTQPEGIEDKHLVNIAFNISYASKKCKKNPLRVIRGFF